jgi:glycolate oxidase
MGEQMTTSSYNKVSAADLEHFHRICGDDGISIDTDDLKIYGSDETEDLNFPPEVVVKPRTTEQVAALMKYCTERRLAVTPRGGGTGLSGGALPVFGGVSLSVEKMNKIIEIDRDNLMVVVQPGVVTQTLQEAVEEVGLFYPPDPASRGSCFIGGNLAENAGGPRALKYGVTKDYVLGVTAVLPSGEIFKSGGKLLKNVSGYNLTQLLVGSEGTLAIITEIILKLIPNPQYRKTLLVPFGDLEQAAVALTKIFFKRIVPCAAEFMERAAIKAAEDKFDKVYPHSDAAAQLLLEVDGNDERLLEEQCEKIAEVCVECGTIDVFIAESKAGTIDVFIAESKARQDEIWEMRRGVGEAVKSICPYKEEDTVVPRAQLPKLVRLIGEIARRYNLTTISYGHAGDGNIHVNILKKNLTDEEWQNKLPQAITELFERVVELGGTISGEHGIGWVQKRYLPLALSSVELRLMRKIKEVFDPQGILNPGKLLPDE